MIIRVDAGPTSPGHDKSSSTPFSPAIRSSVATSWHLVEEVVPQTGKRKIAYTVPLLPHQYRPLGNAELYKHSTLFPKSQSSLSSDLPRCVALRPEAWVALQHRNPFSLYLAKTCFSPLPNLRMKRSSIATMHVHRSSVTDHVIRIGHGSSIDTF